MAERQIEEGQGLGSLLDIPKRLWSIDSPAGRPSTATSQMTLASQATALSITDALEEGERGEREEEQGDLSALQVPPRKRKIKRPSTAWSTSTTMAFESEAQKNKVEEETNDMDEKAGGTNEKADGTNEKADGTSEKADGTNEKADDMNEKTDT